MTDVTTRSRKSRSWLTSSAVPGYSASRSCSRSSVSRSRSLVAPQYPRGKIPHDGLIAVSLGDGLRRRDEPTRQISLCCIELGRSGRGAVLLVPAAERVQLGQPPLVARAPGGDTVAQPVLFHRDFAAQLVLLAGFLLQHCVAPRLECGE